MVDNMYLEYLDILIIPTKPNTLAIKKDGSKNFSKDIQKDLLE
jgi:hypothetical protein